MMMGEGGYIQDAIIKHKEHWIFFLSVLFDLLEAVELQGFILNFGHYNYNRLNKI